MKIAIMGFEFNSSNKGCEALTYSFITMLLECFDKEIEVYNYSYGEFGNFVKHFPNVRFYMRRPRLKDIRDWGKIKKEFDDYDFIFDVTFGDGFSDIYGKKWNVLTNILKTIAIISHTPFILLPQTYGPYKHPLLKEWAKYIVTHADVAYSRDIESAEYMNQFCKNKVVTLTDMAFILSYDKHKFQVDSMKKHIGVNISSLLWDSDYAKKNKFGLKVDYVTYIKELIRELLTDPQIVVHLIPHVVETDDYENPENDVRSCESVKQLFSTKRVIVAPCFENPMDAKSYISKMDFFIGARMHSTIGAVSAGIPTVPFAYSKKFKTMFGNLEYDYVLDARAINTEEAVQMTIDYISKKEMLGMAAKHANELGEKKLSLLKKWLETSKL